MDAKKIIQSWEGKKVLCIGDCCLDVWTYHTVNRISPEAPVPVLDQDANHTFESGDGMGGLVASMVNALGGQATMVARPRHFWQVKTRIMARAPGRGYQPILRIDSTPPKSISDAEADVLLDNARTALLDGCTSILVSDYSKGTVTHYLCQELSKLAGGFRVPIAVDPGRYADWTWYRRMLIKANESEMAGYGAPGEAIRKLELPALIVTGGSDGMELMVEDRSGGCQVTEIPGIPVDGADPCGCGDQAMAVLGLGLAAFGRELDLKFCSDELAQLCELANVAARLQVQRHGCQPVTAQELEEVIKKQQLTPSVAA